MNNKMEKVKDVKPLIEALEKIKQENIRIIVEGKKDKKALNEVGIDNIFVLHSIGKSLESTMDQFMSHLEKKETIIILTDLDKKGEEYYSIVKDDLIKNGFKVDDSLRKLLSKMGISHIEGLSNFVENETN